MQKMVFENCVIGVEETGVMTLPKWTESADSVEIRVPVVKIQDVHVQVG